MTALETRKSIQRLLGVSDDGQIGPRSLAALNRLVGAPDESEWPPRSNVDSVAPSERVDERSERAISTLHPKVQPMARELVRRAAQHEIEIRVTSGTRTYEEQNALYEQGRSKPGKIVTNARGGYSNHNFGIALDVTIFKNGQPVWESPLYKTVGAIGKDIGFEWGGDWKTISDEPHFELHPEWANNISESDMLSQLRSRHSRGLDAFA